MVFAAGPLAECYGWDYQDYNVNTVYEVNVISKYLNNIGYDSHAYTAGTSAYYVRNTMGSDAIFFVAGHGDNGIVQCKDRNGATTFDDEFIYQPTK